MVSTIRSCRDFVFYFFAFLFDLHRPINFRDISDIDDRRKKAFDSRPSQLDSVFAFITRWLVTSRRLIFFGANEGNDSFPFPFFLSLSLCPPPLPSSPNESRRSRVAEERWKKTVEKVSLFRTVGESAPLLVASMQRVG